MTDFKDLCPNCFNNKANKNICPYCNYDESINKEPLNLRFRKILNNQYLVGKHLGKGGFGITYLGWDISLQTLVAIKEFLPSNLATRSAHSSSVILIKPDFEKDFNKNLNKFIKEAQILAKFSHHNIVRVRSFFKENKTGYLVMDYYQGETLDNYLKRHKGRLSERQALRIISPILDALKEVHKLGYLHRDIKPQNIYITHQDAKIILLDFGAARFSGICVDSDSDNNSNNINNTYQTTQEDKLFTVILTHGFAPPEQYSRFGKQGPWTDVYACSALLYYLITGEHVPPALDRKEIDNLIEPIKKANGVSKKVNSGIMKGLELNILQRPQTIDEFKKLIMLDVQIGSLNTINSTQELFETKIICSSCKKENQIVNFSNCEVSFCVYCGGKIRQNTCQDNINSNLDDKTLIDSDLNVSDLNAFDYYKLGTEFLNNQDYRKASESFNKALETDPFLAEVYNGRGEVNFYEGNIDKALEDFNRAIAIKKNYSDAYNNRGALYCYKNEYILASKDFAKAIELKPDYFEAYNNLGFLYSEQENYQEAIKNFTKAINIKPDYSDAYNNRANSYLKTGETKKALQDFEKFLYYSSPKDARNKEVREKIQELSL